MELEFTGERVVPGMAITYGVIEHLHRYAVAREFCGGRIVLDIGLGISSLADELSLVVAADRLSCTAGRGKGGDLRDKNGTLAAAATVTPVIRSSGGGKSGYYVHG